jgi:hypothetical protein
MDQPAGCPDRLLLGLTGALLALLILNLAVFDDLRIDPSAAVLETFTKPQHLASLVAVLIAGALVAFRGTVLLSSHLLAEVEAVADRMMIIGGGRIQAQGTRAELLAASGTIVAAADLATLDAVLHHAGLATHPAGGDRRLVDAEPEVVARLAMANDLVLHRLEPADGAGLERLFFELTTSGGTAPSPKSDPIHAELAGATA